MKKNILFDMDGVMSHGYHFNPNLRTCWDETIEQDIGINRKAFTEGFIFKSFQNILVGIENIHDALEKFLPTIGYYDNPQVVIDYWLEKDTDFNQEMIEIVKTLKASGDFNIYLATNQEDNRAHFLMAHCDFDELFDDIFHSAKIGYKKPDAAYFANVHQRIGSPKEPPLFFDDTLKYVEAAKNFGWNAHQFVTANDVRNNPTLAPYLR